MVSFLTPTADHWACDIEADNLLDEATTIHCVCVENIVTGEKNAFTDTSLFRDWLPPSAVLVGHNFLAYDLVMLNRFWNAGITTGRVIDTYVLSQLYNPSLRGGHSLQAWGGRLRHPKTEHDDYSVFTPEMLAYCENDTSLTALLYRKLAGLMVKLGFTEDGVELEHKAWHIIQNKQRRNGFPFDYEEAQKLYVTLREKEDELKTEIYRLWPPRLDVVKVFAKAFKKDGSKSASYERHAQQYPKLRIHDDGTYSGIDWVSFDLGSPQQRVQKLLELGWEPVEFTPKTDKGGGGNPRVDEDSLTTFAEKSGQPEVKSLATWIVVNSRANMIRTWMNAYNPKTGAIHGRLMLASTLRYRHSDPNSANIPAVRLKKDDNGNDEIQFGEAGSWTYEARDLWTAGGDPFVLVGLDGTGIQNRCLIHSLIETVGEDLVRPFTELSLEGDIHKRNIDLLGLANKAASKKFYYTLMMGGGGGRLAADQVQFGTKMTAKQASHKKKLLVDSIPGFRALIKRLQDELSRSGRIKLCDGTPILVPSDHMVIPYRLQGDESRLMKRAMVYVDEFVRRKKLSDYVFKVADIHDEFQYRVHRDCCDDFIAGAIPCFRRSGDSFNYRIVIDGDAKVGKTWAGTH